MQERYQRWWMSSRDMCSFKRLGWCRCKNNQHIKVATSAPRSTNLSLLQWELSWLSRTKQLTHYEHNGKRWLSDYLTTCKESRWPWTRAIVMERGDGCCWREMTAFQYWFYVNSRRQKSMTSGSWKAKKDRKTWFKPQFVRKRINIRESKTSFYLKFVCPPLASLSLRLCLYFVWLLVVRRVWLNGNGSGRLLFSCTQLVWVQWKTSLGVEMRGNGDATVEKLRSQGDAIVSEPQYIFYVCFT
jgi:hypothetical protein